VDDVPAVSERSESNRHWADLDGLRAFAILLVLGRHSLRPFISEDAYSSVVTLGPIDVTPLVLNGWIGVDLFFVLSGFLIGRQAWRGDSLLRFWFKRVTRILPAYWVSPSMPSWNQVLPFLQQIAQLREIAAIVTGFVGPRTD
jgi:peptidoglycan/LPS O-acetylase OafA/YrhL